MNFDPRDIVYVSKIDGGYHLRNHNGKYINYFSGGLFNTITSILPEGISVNSFEQSTAGNVTLYHCVDSTIVCPVAYIPAYLWDDIPL